MVTLALVLAVLGTYVSLITGLWPAMAFAALAVWLFLAIVCLRSALVGHTWWRVLLPGFFLLLTFLVYGYGLQYLAKKRYKTEGYPRRYYSWDTAK
ncbi:hypothetical protein Q5H92_14080 [Hymenobacter sp. M29]|uniref:Uncharacterized protein n=1 Tax=Hymenobacter mellowenesis TaxID=3063995 RepID=A0ABT9ACC8_9BACT|nr:hypothetical protein [Hymenobacter sp. M29]MDO7847495.1 hypothetical protein [Hymenobacter sp. M29]